MQEILDNAQHGVIYFSMGSSLKSSQMNPELKSILLKVFGSMKQTILWKYEEPLENIPKNLHIRQWMPQNDILGMSVLQTYTCKHTRILKKKLKCFQLTRT